MDLVNGRLKPLDFKRVSEDYFVAETSIGRYEVSEGEDDGDDGLIWLLWTPFKDYGDLFSTYEEAAKMAWEVHSQAVIQLFEA